jgi:predicted  nucleic acid-binding Zn-ribbon protein
MNNLIDNLFALQELEYPQHKTTPEATEKIKMLRELVPPPILGHYDRLLARNKKGVALVRNGVCCECHMRVAIGVLNTLMRRADIELCGSCGRYLYLPEAPAEPIATPAPEPPKPATRKRKPRATANA